MPYVVTIVQDSPGGVTVTTLGPYPTQRAAEAERRRQHNSINTNAFKWARTFVSKLVSP